jgi:hypothetical protein
MGRWEARGSMSYVLMAGNPVDGFRVYGPFATTENSEAEARAQQEWPDSGCTWWYLPITAGDERFVALESWWGSLTPEERGMTGVELDPDED